MERIINEAQLLKEVQQSIKLVMGAIRKKHDLCLRRDGAHDLAYIRHLRDEHFVVVFIAIILYWCNFPKNI